MTRAGALSRQLVRRIAGHPVEWDKDRRDAVRLLVSDGSSDRVVPFTELAGQLLPGDLLVVNESATLPASLPARADFGEFRLNLSTDFGDNVWLAEPRWSPSRPGPVPLDAGEEFEAAGLSTRVIGRYPGIRRLAFVRISGDAPGAMHTLGSPIRYGYAEADFGLAAYQTIFARVPGSAEMPSAARPFTPETLAALTERGVRVERIVLHSGVSSLEEGDVLPGYRPVFPEPFDVPARVVHAIEFTRRRGGRVVVVGTTVLRALESAMYGGRPRPTQGFTQAYLRPARPVTSVDGLLTGLHDTGTTHLALMNALVPPDRLDRAYRTAESAGLLWHEFGDSHLVWRRPSPQAAG
ncbi:MAG: S-adenosylmethionine:tRNA ribosyltransferase-isomerase [Thermoplasmata archaeon]